MNTDKSVSGVKFRIIYITWVGVERQRRTGPQSRPTLTTYKEAMSVKKALKQ